MFQGRDQLSAWARKVRAPAAWKSVTRLWTRTNPSSTVVQPTAITISWGERGGGEQLEGVNGDPALKKFALMKKQQCKSLRSRARFQAGEELTLPREEDIMSQGIKNRSCKICVPA